MSLKLFFDAAGVQPVLTAERFTGVGPFTLTAFTGAQLGGVYKETKIDYAGIAFVNGVGSGFTGLVVDSLKSQRVIHDNRYIGQVISNTDTTITVSNAAYTKAAAPATLAAYVKLYTPTDFTLAGSVISVIASLGANEVLHAVPTDALAMYFGGTAGETVTKVTKLYLRRSTDFEYTTLQVSSDDISLQPYHTSTAGIVFAAGVGTGFTGLVIDSLVGKAVNHAGVFRGLVIANTETTVTINSAYNGLAATAEIYNVGSLEFSIDNVTFSKVLPVADLVESAVVVSIYVRDTVNVPAAAINYPSNIIKVSGIEFIA